MPLIASSSSPIAGRASAIAASVASWQMTYAGTPSRVGAPAPPLPSAARTASRRSPSERAARTARRRDARAARRAAAAPGSASPADHVGRAARDVQRLRARGRPRAARPRCTAAAGAAPSPRCRSLQHAEFSRVCQSYWRICVEPWPIEVAGDRARRRPRTAARGSPASASRTVVRRRLFIRLRRQAAFRRRDAVVALAAAAELFRLVLEVVEDRVVPARRRLGIADHRRAAARAGAAPAPATRTARPTR